MANNISRANRIKRSPGDAFVQVLLYVFVALNCTYHNTLCKELLDEWVNTKNRDS